MSTRRSTHAHIPVGQQLCELARVAEHAADTQDPAILAHAVGLAFKFGLSHGSDRIDLLAAVLVGRIDEVGDEALDDLHRRASREYGRRQKARSNNTKTQHRAGRTTRPA